MKLIAVVSENWGLGLDGKLLFNLPQDMKFFKYITNNKIVVMGKKTLLSFPNSKPLPNRINIVLTRDKDFKEENVIVCHSLDELFKEIENFRSEDVFVIGGGNVFYQLQKYCDEIFITKVQKLVKADTFLYNFDEDENWMPVIKSKEFEENGMRFTFNTYYNKKLN
jgi:dihydrofolate reductase